MEAVHSYKTLVNTYLTTWLYIPETDQFYEQSERTYIQCPSYDIEIIIGDFNTEFEMRAGLKHLWDATA
jgi:hypothetical protein